MKQLAILTLAGIIALPLHAASSLPTFFTPAKPPCNPQENPYCGAKMPVPIPQSPGMQVSEPVPCLSEDDKACVQVYDKQLKANYKQGFKDYTITSPVWSYAGGCVLANEACGSYQQRWGGYVDQLQQNLPPFTPSPRPPVQNGCQQQFVPGAGNFINPCPAKAGSK